MNIKHGFIPVLALVGSSLLSAQSGISGKWVTTKKSQLPVTMEFKSSGTNLAGTLRLGDASQVVTVGVLDGKVVGDRVSFKVMMPTEGDERYAMMFAGQRSGDKIKFKCNVEVNPPGDKTAVGPACLAEMTVKRVSK